MRRLRRTMRLLTAFLALCVGASPLFVVSSVAASASGKAPAACAMTQKSSCKCCVPTADTAAAKPVTLADAGCKCAVTPSPVAPADAAPRDVVRVFAVVALAPIPTGTLAPVFLPAATPPVGSHAPPPRSAASAPDAGRAPPAF